MFRLAELLGPLAAAADSGAGLPPETGARTALIGLRLAERCGLRSAALGHVYYAGMLRHLGCSATAHEETRLMGDEQELHVALGPVDAGSPLQILRGAIFAARCEVFAGNSSYYWVDVAGTSQGFVFINGTQPVNEIFVPIVDGGAAVLFDGGIATTLDGGPLPGFRFPGTAGAVIGRAISDYTGGRGGAGVALQFTNAAEFMYVNPDGVTHVGPNQVISRAFGTGDIIALTQFGGSFGVSVYSASEHLTRMAASGCVP